MLPITPRRRRPLVGLAVLVAKLISQCRELSTSRVDEPIADLDAHVNISRRICRGSLVYLAD